MSSRKMRRMQAKKARQQARRGRGPGGGGNAQVDALFSQAQALHQQGRMPQAEAAYEAILKRSPRHIMSLNMLGILFSQTRRFDQALGCFDRALKVDDAFASAHYNRGLVLLEKRQHSEAAAAMERTLKLEPHHLDAGAQLAGIQEHRNQPDKAIETAQRVLLQNPDHSLANMILVRSLRRQKRYEDAWSALEAFPLDNLSQEGEMELAFEMAETCDRLARYDEAFGHYKKANALQLQMESRRDLFAYPQEIVQLKEQFTPQWVESWSENPPTTRQPPIFLVGFPRSGTTLLDRILSSHPQIRSMEEQYLFQKIRQRLPGIFPANLANLKTGTISALREQYFKLVEKQLGPLDENEYLLDKLPLNLVEAGLIHRIFPDAKFILALRHPRDVCLSCFFQKFNLNRAMIHFHTLESAAKLYVQAMDLWFHFTNTLPLIVHTHRYEDLIKEFDGTIKPLISFLDLPWHDEIRDFRQKTKGAHINTPSYHQVAQPIYSRSVARWKNYEGFYGEVGAVLGDMEKKLGY